MNPDEPWPGWQERAEATWEADPTLKPMLTVSEDSLPVIIHSTVPALTPWQDQMLKNLAVMDTQQMVQRMQRMQRMQYPMYQIPYPPKYYNMPGGYMDEDYVDIDKNPITPTVYVALDVETTGLHPFGDDALLQVALQLYNSKLEPISTVHEYTVYYDEEEVQRLFADADPYVREMHTKNGIWNAIQSYDSAEDIDDIQDQLIDLIEGCQNQKDAPSEITFMLLGNSIRLDMNFIEACLPQFYAKLHYRMLDVSAVAQFAQDFFGIISPRKKHAHTAAADIEECINQLNFLIAELKKLHCPDPLAHHVPLAV